jgi:hypothetical protein
MSSLYELFPGCIKRRRRARGRETLDEIVHRPTVREFFEKLGNLVVFDDTYKYHEASYFCAIYHNNDYGCLIRSWCDCGICKHPIDKADAYELKYYFDECLSSIISLPSLATLQNYVRRNFMIPSFVQAVSALQDAAEEQTTVVAAIPAEQSNPAAQSNPVSQLNEIGNAPQQTAQISNSQYFWTTSPHTISIYDTYPRFPYITGNR